MSAEGHTTVDDSILQRIRGEFLEMPGLRLTCQQAQRLWGLDGHVCQLLLEFLVEAKFLYQPRNGMYMRASGHRADWPQAQMARPVWEQIDSK